MTKNDTNPAVRFQKHGKRVGRVTCIIGARKAGKGRIRNRIHRAASRKQTVNPSQLVPSWMADAARIAREERERTEQSGRIGLLGIRISA